MKNEAYSITSTNRPLSFSQEKAYFLLGLGLFFFIAIKESLLSFYLIPMISFNFNFIMDGLTCITLLSFLYALKQTYKQTRLAYPSIALFIAALAVFSGIRSLNEPISLHHFKSAVQLCCGTILLGLSLIKIIDNVHGFTKSFWSNIILCLLLSLVVDRVGPWNNPGMESLGIFAVLLFLKIAVMQYGVEKTILPQYHEKPLKGILYLFLMMWVVFDGFVCTFFLS